MGKEALSANRDSFRLLTFPQGLLAGPRAQRSLRPKADPYASWAKSTFPVSGTRPSGWHQSKNPVLITEKRGLWLTSFRSQHPVVWYPIGRNGKSSRCYPRKATSGAEHLPDRKTSLLKDLFHRRHYSAVSQARGETAMVLGRCLSFLRAFCSICRTLSRDMPNRFPISSKV